ncbi:unnamed protein product [Rhizoctonia solani]|uniref:Uncharacterized protein n=1 Tax=Rhizoctonia solani TaxID=456999 RepID=A0A8H3GX62_9AGAM|nr:unnamed protein product [Rhizoctonia solani]
MGRQKAGLDLAKQRQDSPDWDIEEMETDDPPAYTTSDTDFTPASSRTRFTILEQATVAGTRELGTIPGGQPRSADGTWHLPTSGDNRPPRTGVLNRFVGSAQAQQEQRYHEHLHLMRLWSRSGRRVFMAIIIERSIRQGKRVSAKALGLRSAIAVRTSSVYRLDGLHVWVIMVRDQWDSWQAHKEAEEEDLRMDDLALELHIAQLMRSRMYRILALFL